MVGFVSYKLYYTGDEPISESKQSVFLGFSTRLYRQFDQKRQKATSK